MSTDLHKAPFTVFRVASLPSGSLNLGQTLMPAVLDDVCTARQRRDEQGRELADVIHGVVPVCSEVDRRALLKLRRDLYNGRAPCETGLRVAQSHGIDVIDLFRLQQAALAALRTIEDTVERDSSRAEWHVRAMLKKEDVNDALRLLSPGFHAAIDRPSPAGSKRGRSALAFAARAALKPSPLSTLTRTAVSGMDLTGRISSLSPIVAASVLDALARRKYALPSLTYVSTVKGIGDMLIASPETSAMVDGFVIFARQAVRIHSDDTEARLLSVWSGGDADALIAVAGDGGWARAQRWMSSGAVQPTPPWCDVVDRPEDVLGAIMTRSTSNDIVRAGHLLLDIGRGAARLATLSGASRSARIACLEAQLRRLFESLEVCMPSGRLINEDAGTAPPASPPLTEDTVSILAETLRPTTFRSHVYDLLLDSFVSAAGAGGTIKDVLGFLTSCWTSSAFRRALRKARQADRGQEAHVGRDDLPVGVTAAPPALSVFLQRTPNDAGSDIVVNQVMPGLGAIVARFGELGGDPSALEHPVSEWLSRLYPGVDDRRALLPGMNVNPLQRAATSVLRVLQSADSSHSLAGLTLKHDALHGVFEVAGEDGQPVALVPLGTVPAWTFDGPLGLLLCLVDPWIDGSQVTREADPIRRARQAEVLEQLPRLATRRVVVRRQSWRIPIAMVPKRGNLTPGRFLVVLHEWRRSLGMPEEVFVRVHGDNPLDSATRKPLWLRFTSWYTVSAVWALLSGRHTLEVQESLPGRTDSGHVTEEAITVSWARPGQGEAYESTQPYQEGR